MGILKSVTVRVTTAGSNATASGNTDSESFVGSVEGVWLAYGTSPAATTDLTITDKASGATILARLNSNADGYITPGVMARDDGDVELNIGEPRKYMVSEGVNLALAQANVEANHLVATVIYSKGN